MCTVVSFFFTQTITVGPTNGSGVGLFGNFDLGVELRARFVTSSDRGQDDRRFTRFFTIVDSRVPSGSFESFARRSHPSTHRREGRGRRYPNHADTGRGWNETPRTRFRPRDPGRSAVSGSWDPRHRIGRGSFGPSQRGRRSGTFEITRNIPRY